MRGLAPDNDPVALATAAHPPIRLMHGDADPIVPIEISRRYLAKLQELGVESELVVVEGEATDGRSSRGVRGSSERGGTSTRLRLGGSSKRSRPEGAVQVEAMAATRTLAFAGSQSALAEQCRSR